MTSTMDTQTQKRFCRILLNNSFHATNWENVKKKEQSVVGRTVVLYKNLNNQLCQDCNVLFF